MDSSSSVVSFTQCSPTCGRMPLPALSLWPGRQPYRPRLVGGRRGGGPSSVAPHKKMDDICFSYSITMKNTRIQVLPYNSKTMARDQT